MDAPTQPLSPPDVRRPEPPPGQPEPKGRRSEQGRADRGGGGRQQRGEDNPIQAARNVFETMLRANQMSRHPDAHRAAALSAIEFLREMMERKAIKTKDRVAVASGVVSEILDRLNLDDQDKLMAPLLDRTIEIEKRIADVRDLMRQRFEELRGAKERAVPLRETMADDPRFKKVENELVKAWEKTNGSRFKDDDLRPEFIAFVNGGAGEASLEEKAKVRFAEKYSEVAKAYQDQERVRVYPEAKDDPAVQKVEQEISGVFTAELADYKIGRWGEVAAKAANDPDGEQRLQNNIIADFWLRFITAYPEKAEGYKDKIEGIRAALESQAQKTATVEKPAVVTPATRETKTGYDSLTLEQLQQELIRTQKIEEKSEKQMRVLDPGKPEHDLACRQKESQASLRQFIEAAMKRKQLEREQLSIKWQTEPLSDLKAELEMLQKKNDTSERTQELRRFIEQKEKEGPTIVALFLELDKYGYFQTTTYGTAKKWDDGDAAIAAEKKGIVEAIAKQLNEIKRRIQTAVEEGTTVEGPAQVFGVRDWAYEIADLVGKISFFDARQKYRGEEREKDVARLEVLVQEAVRALKVNYKGQPPAAVAAPVEAAAVKPPGLEPAAVAEPPKKIATVISPTVEGGAPPPEVSGAIPPLGGPVKTEAAEPLVGEKKNYRAEYESKRAGELLFILHGLEAKSAPTEEDQERLTAVRGVIEEHWRDFITEQKGKHKDKTAKALKGRIAYLRKEEKKQDTSLQKSPVGSQEWAGFTADPRATKGELEVLEEFLKAKEEARVVFQEHVSTTLSNPEKLLQRWQRRPLKELKAELKELKDIVEKRTSFLADPKSVEGEWRQVFQEEKDNNEFELRKKLEIFEKDQLTEVVLKREAIGEQYEPMPPSPAEKIGEFYLCKGSPLSSLRKLLDFNQRAVGVLVKFLENPKTLDGDEQAFFDSNFKDVPETDVIIKVREAIWKKIELVKIVKEREAEGLTVGELLLELEGSVEKKAGEVLGDPLSQLFTGFESRVSTMFNDLIPGRLKEVKASLEKALQAEGQPEEAGVFVIEEWAKKISELLGEFLAYDLKKTQSEDAQEPDRSRLEALIQEAARAVKASQKGRPPVAALIEGTVIPTNVVEAPLTETVTPPEVNDRAKKYRDMRTSDLFLAKQKLEGKGDRNEEENQDLAVIQEIIKTRWQGRAEEFAQECEDQSFEGKQRRVASLREEIDRLPVSKNDRQQAVNEFKCWERQGMIEVIYRSMGTNELFFAMQELEENEEQNAANLEIVKKVVKERWEKLVDEVVAENQEVEPDELIARIQKLEKEEIATEKRMQSLEAKSRERAVAYADLFEVRGYLRAYQELLVAKTTKKDKADDQEGDQLIGPPLAPAADLGDESIDVEPEKVVAKEIDPFWKTIEGRRAIREMEGQIKDRLHDVFDVKRVILEKDEGKIDAEGAFREILFLVKENSDNFLRYFREGGVTRGKEGKAELARVENLVKDFQIFLDQLRERFSIGLMAARKNGEQILHPAQVAENPLSDFGLKLVKMESLDVGDYFGLIDAVIKECLDKEKIVKAVQPPTLEVGGGGKGPGEKKEKKKQEKKPVSVPAKTPKPKVEKIKSPESKMSDWSLKQLEDYIKMWSRIAENLRGFLEDPSSVTNEFEREAMNARGSSQLREELEKANTNLEQAMPIYEAKKGSS